jgi:signal transduction histidine kinase/ActR/RegA family two-component response regulator
MSPAPHPSVPLSEILITEKIAKRPARMPDHQGESLALVALMRRLKEPDADHAILQDVAEAALSLCRAGSAGISILEPAEDGDGEVFRWHGSAGRWGRYRHGTLRRQDSPCDAVVTGGRPLLMSHPERHYPLEATQFPPLEEALLVPFSTSGGLRVGTIWVIAHDTSRHFDAEDLRLLGDLAEVASVAYQLTEQRRQLRESLDRERAGAKLLQSISGGMVVEDDASALYDQILDAALTLMNSPCASLQKLEPDGSLHLLAWRGFDPESARFWARIEPGSSSVCELAHQAGVRQVLADIEARPDLVDAVHMAEYRRSGIRAVQSTPLLTRDGRLIGMMSTHWHEPHAPSSHELRLFDVLARETADLMERAAAAAALREADRHKDEFLAVLGHELRNPLAPLSTGIELMRRGGQTPEFLDHLFVMMGRQVAHLTRLVDDLLDLSRIGRGQLELRPAVVNLRDVIDTAVDLARPAIERGRHTLSVDLDSQLPCVDGDPQRLTQVVTNLLTNAAKYTEPGGRITLSAAVEGGQAVLRVADTGLGIPPQALHSIFDMFAQVPEHRESRSRRGAGGLGIGLALSRRLAELHQGSLTAHSRGLGHGSEFSLRLPVAAAATAAPAASEVEPPRTAATPRPCRVLVVDDNIDAATSLCNALQLDRHEVAVAYDGAQALAQADSFSPEALLIDIDLPDMDGYELARRLRERDPEHRLLLAAVTGWGQGDDRDEALAAGFDLHLTKPVRLDDLNAFLSRAGQGGRQRAAPA